MSNGGAKPIHVIVLGGGTAGWMAATGVAGAVAAAGAAGAALAGVAPDGVALADAEALTGASLPGTGGSAANTGSVINPLAMIIIDFENV